MEMMTVQRDRRRCAGWTRVVRWAVMLAAMAGPVRSAEAQSAAVVEFTAGMAAFIDEVPIGHHLIGAAVRVPVTPRLSVGPEIVYMRGPGNARNVFGTGNLTFDLRDAPVGRPRRIMPFLVVGGGVSRLSNRFNGSPFSSHEFAITGGGGVRVWFTPRVYVAGEYRVGWEPHARITGTLGFALSPPKG
jgi:hypothetical protein